MPDFDNNHDTRGPMDLVLDIGEDGKPFLLVPGKLKVTLSRKGFRAFAARVKHLDKIIKEKD